MNSEEKYIELRVANSGNPYVAVLGGICAKYGFERIFNPFRGRSIRHPDGRKEQVHMLPGATLTYEIKEMRDGKQVTWYAATVEGDSRIHRISRYGAEMVAKNAMPISRVIDGYPEMPPIEVEDE